jgi:O-antigen/teichoic acid export membrane protein
MGGILLGAERIRAFNLLRLLAPALQAVTLLAIWALRPALLDVPLALAIWGAATLVAAIATRAALGRTPGGAARGRPAIRQGAVLRRALSYGWRVHLGGIAAFLGMRLMHFLVGGLQGAAALGIYAIAVSGAEVLAYFAVAEAIVLMPAAAALPADRRWEVIERRTLRTLLLFSIAAGAALLLVEPVIRLLFGRDFLPAAPVFRLLVPGMAAHSLNLLLGAGLRAANRPAAPTRAAWISLLITAPLAVPAIGAWGILGAAGVFSGAQAIAALLLLRSVVAERRRCEPVDGAASIARRSRSAPVASDAATRELPDAIR